MGARLFERPRPGRMHRDTGAGQRHRLELDADNLFSLQLLEDPVEHPVLRPPLHPQGDGVPVAKPCRYPAPFAALLGDLQDGVEPLLVCMGDVAALPRQVWRDPFALSLCQFHPERGP